MVDQMNTNVVNEIEPSREKDAAATASYRTETRRPRKSRFKDNVNDELIVSLSDAYENQRARQVSEWEYMRRQNVHAAA